MLYRPADLPDALSALGRGEFQPLCGGTDVFPALVDRPPVALLDLSRLRELRGIVVAADHIRIGAGTTWTDILRAKLPPAYDMLKSAARQIGSVQIQNRATIGGNLCNASPAADSVPPLLALDAEVELASSAATRVISLAAFLRGNRMTARNADELLIAVRVPRTVENARSAFVKFGARKYLVISIVMVAVALRIVDDAITEARIAVGAASVVAQRLGALEVRLIGQRVSADWSALIAEDDLASLSPIDDVRATAAYRLDAARELIARALRAAVDA